MSDLAIENNMLLKKVRELEHKIHENDQYGTEQNEKKISAEVKKLKQQILQKDKKNT